MRGGRQGHLALALLVALGAGWSGPAPARAQAPPATSTPGRGGPFPALAEPVHLPALRFNGDEAPCAAWVQAQNLGAEPSKVALLVWGAGGACSGGSGPCAAPAILLCSGLLAPGTAWSFGGPDLPPTATSAIAYSFSLRRLSELGSGVVPDKPVADYLCGLMAASVLGSCDNFGRFKEAYESGVSLGGVRLALAYGGSLALSVSRRCPDSRVKVPVQSLLYPGLSGQSFGGRDSLFSWSSYYLAGLEEDPELGRQALLHIQNGGPRCASVEIWLRELGECQRTRFCRSLLVAPGATVRVAGADCLRPGSSATAWLRSSEPLAVLAELLSPAGRAGHAAIPAEIQLGPAGPPLFTAGSSYLHGPLPPPRAGVETEVQAQNLSSVDVGTVQVTFLDAGGEALAPGEVHSLCPRGTAAWPVPGDLAAGRPAASVRIESRPWRGPGGAGTPATKVSATVIQRRSAGQRDLMASFGLAPPATSRPDPQGRDPAGARLLAVPRLAELGAGGLAITNAVPEAGTTNVTVLVYDASGPVSSRCLQLAAGATAWLAAADLDLPGTAFRGSAVISASAWQHPLFDLRGRQIGQRVGLMALAVTGGEGGGTDVLAGGDPASWDLTAEAALAFAVDGPVNPFAHLAPDCPTLPARAAGPSPWRVYLPWLGR